MKGSIVVMANALNHKKDERVMYGSNGICRIVDIDSIRFGPMKPALYYVLIPEYDSASKIYVPVENETLTSQMRHVMTKEEIDSLIMNSGETGVAWVEEGKEREAVFRGILEAGNRAEILEIFKLLYIYKRNAEENKKKFYERDAKLLNAAAKSITEEFSFVLGISADDVIPYILGKLDVAE